MPSPKLREEAAGIVVLSEMQNTFQAGLVIRTGVCRVRYRFTAAPEAAFRPETAQPAGALESPLILSPFRYPR
jgi:hypothetical protein